MNRSTLIALLVAAGVLLGAGGFYLGRHAPNSAAKPIACRQKGLVLARPMVSGSTVRQAGKSPFMDMQLVPVYADSDSAEGAVKSARRCARTWHPDAAVRPTSRRLSIASAESLSA